jgi:hypothetical protein
MRVPLQRLAAIGAAMFVLASAGTAEAQGKGRGKDKKHDSDRVQTRGDDRRHDDRDVYDRRGEYDPRHDGTRDGTPPGRAKKGGLPPGLAKKPGGMPPGQYKKHYTADHGASVLRDVLGRRGYPVIRTADAGTSEHVYYRDHEGHVRRAIVSPGTDRLRFSNVPSSLLSEVISRLY